MIYLGGDGLGYVEGFVVQGLQGVSAKEASY
jgi:hypothetical protein